MNTPPFPHSSANSRKHSPRLLLFISFMAFISLGLPDGLLGVSWPSISTSFGKALSRLAVLQAALTCGFFFSSINAGRLSERFGVGKLLIGSNVLIAIALSAYTLADRW
ncbi:MAG: MFS transporter, partial [Spirochaetia bacterium]